MSIGIVGRMRQDEICHGCLWGVSEENARERRGGNEIVEGNGWNEKESDHSQNIDVY